MPTYVLVASPLVGPGGWRWLAAALEARGHTVVVPSLAPPDTARPVWVAHVERVTAALDGVGYPLLVGHSAAGRLVPLVADRTDDARCLYVDAQLPVDVLPTADDDWFADHVRALTVHDRLPPWSEWWGADAWARLVPDPARRDTLAATLPRVPPEAVLEVPPAPRRQAPSAYLRLSAVYDAEAAVAEAAGWPVIRLDAGHLHFAVDEVAVADAMEALTAQLDG